MFAVKLKYSPRFYVHAFAFALEPISLYCFALYADNHYAEQLPTAAIVGFCVAAALLLLAVLIDGCSMWLLDNANDVGVVIESMPPLWVWWRFAFIVILLCCALVGTSGLWWGGLAVAAVVLYSVGALVDSIYFSFEARP